MNDELKYELVMLLRIEKMTILYDYWVVWQRIIFGPDKYMECLY